LAESSLGGQRLEVRHNARHKIVAVKILKAYQAELGTPESASPLRCAKLAAAQVMERVVHRDAQAGARERGPDRPAVDTGSSLPDGAALSLGTRRPSALLRLQRTTGNQSVLNLLHRGQPAPPAHVQRVDVSGLRVTGAYKEAKYEDLTIFFKLSLASLDEIELQKIDDAAFDYENDELKLIASASEDEVLLDPDDLDDLLNERLAAVEQGLKSKGFKGTVQTAKKPRSGLGRIDYRESRQVEIVPPSKTSARSSERPPAYVEGTSDHTDRFDGVLKAAKKLLDPAIAALGIEPLDPTLGALVSQFFGDADQAKEVAKNLGLIQAHINTNVNHLLPLKEGKPEGRPGYAVAGPGNSAYSTSTAYNEGTGANSLITLCKGFFEGDINAAAGTLIHEAAHGTVGLVTEDFAYAHERTIGFLDTARALRNSDSYVLLLRLFDKPGSVKVGRPLADTTASGMSPALKHAALRSVAWVEKWLITTYQDVEGLYQEVADLETGEKLKKPGYDYNLMEELHIDLRVTDPDLPITDEDRVALAGIYDRLLEMRHRFDDPVEITSLDDDTTWTNSGPTLDVPATFIDLTPLKQAEKVLRAVINANTAIRSTDQLGFSEVVSYIRKAAKLGEPV
jgi:hypothetical protein